MTQPQTTIELATPEPVTVDTPVTAAPTTPAAELPPAVQSNGHAETLSDRHVQAGRKGAHRVHQLIQLGRLYEKEHGLKRGRQRLRQLLELGKLYEKEHGLRPSFPRKRSPRLSRLGRTEVLETLLHCLLRMAKPSFRTELQQLVEALKARGNDHAA
jgi:hypothetical protein